MRRAVDFAVPSPMHDLTEIRWPLTSDLSAAFELSRICLPLLKDSAPEHVNPILEPRPELPAGLTPILRRAEKRDV